MKKDKIKRGTLKDSIESVAVEDSVESAVLKEFAYLFETVDLPDNKEKEKFSAVEENLSDSEKDILNRYSYLFESSKESDYNQAKKHSETSSKSNLNDIKQYGLAKEDTVYRPKKQIKKPFLVKKDTESIAKVSTDDINKMDNKQLMAYILSNISKNSPELAERLILNFGTVFNVLNASVQSLLEVDGVNMSTAIYLNSFYQIMLRANMDNSKLTDNLKSIAGYKSFYIEVFKYCAVEEMHLLCLNANEKYITNIIFSKGYVDIVDYDVSLVAKKAVATGAKYVVLAHNHTSISGKPSREDLKFTLNAERILSNFGLVLKDHIIVSRENIISVFTESDYLQLKADGVIKNW